MSTPTPPPPAGASPEDTRERSPFPWLRPFFAGICLRPVLLAILVLTLGILWAGLGRHYGVPDLFWSEDTWVQILAGLGVTLLLAEVCFIAYLLDEDRDWLQEGWETDRWLRFPDRLLLLIAPDLRPTPKGMNPWRPLRWYFSVTWLPLVVLLALSTVVYWTTDVPWPNDPADQGKASYCTESSIGWGQGPAWAFRVAGDTGWVIGLRQRWPFLVGIVAAAFVLRLLVRVFQRFRVGGPEAPAVKPKLPWGKHGAVALFFIGLLALMIRWHLSPLALCCVLWFWLLVQGRLVYSVRLRGVPPERRWRHRLAGWAFLAWYLVYGGLFLVYWLDSGESESGLFSRRVAPPALILCLLLALLATCYGFLRYHFGGWYILVALVLLAVGFGVNSASEFKLYFPGLEPYYDRSVSPVEEKDPPRVALAEDDFETLYLTLKGGDLSEEQARLARVRLHRSLTNLCARGRALAEALEKHPKRERAFKDPDKAQKPEKWLKQYEEADRRLVQLEVQRLRRWKNLAKNGKKGDPKLVVVCVTGGASRSGLWTAIVLDKLERKLPGFPRHVRLITGASGGMVGAAYWVATLPDAGGHPARGEGSFDPYRVARDHLTPVAQRLLFVDVPMIFLPGPGAPDRGVALEGAWKENLGGELNVSFKSLAAGEARGWRPSLILSPMLVEDGRQLLISNLYLSFLTEAEGPNLSPDHERPRSEPGRQNVDMRQAGRNVRRVTRPTRRARTQEKLPRYRYSLKGVEFFNLFPDDEKFKLSTAVRMNASFPYVSPAVDLPVTPRRRVVDAGYFDNYGVSVAAAWLHHHRRWLKANTSGVALVQIRDSASDNRRLYANTVGEGWRWSRGIEWLTGPLVGAGSARESGMSFRNDGELERLADYFNIDGKGKWKGFFTTVVFESRVEVALSWYLPAPAIKQMDRNFEKTSGEEEAAPNALALTKLQKWWNGVAPAKK
jgi:hypothetical protein